MTRQRDSAPLNPGRHCIPAPCTEQPVNRDLRIPAVCLSGSFTIAFMSVTPQAVPARYTPAFRLSLVRSCHGGTSPESHSCLQPTMKLSRFTVLGQCPSSIEFGRGYFARIFSELFVNFTIGRLSFDSSPFTNRNPQGWFHIQFRAISKISQVSQLSGEQNGKRRCCSGQQLCVEKELLC